MKQLFTIVCIFVFGMSTIHAQMTSGKNGITFKKLFLDYQSMNGGEFFNFKDYRHGYEFAYNRMLTDKISLFTPLRYGVVDAFVDSVHCLKKSIVSFDLQGQYRFYDNTKTFQPYALLGLGASYESADGNFIVDNVLDFQIPAGLGLRIRLADNATIDWQSEFRFSLLESKNTLVHGLGFTYMIGKSSVEKPKVMDTDGDGIPDDKDDCPLIFGLATLKGCPDGDGDGIPDHLDKCPEVFGLKQFDGCPDTDGDGIPDHLDKCPNEKGVKSLDGCPEKPMIIDSDGDGVPDDEDECPNEKGSAETNGCPDTDGDGVPDKIDRCPTKPGLRIYNGCPDTDGDGIDDSRDRCPDTPGTVANDGCPEIKQEDKRTLEIAMQAVQFETGRSVLKTESYSILNQIAEIMARYPDFNMQISGHTDNTGNAALNQDLSERRAKTCYDYLVGKGVSPTRMTHTGFGETRPVSSNDTEKGRSFNRRVEFNLVPRQ